ncbi:MAG TPA: 50S ribosomal protein L11 methyltransferase [Gemmatimonadaceae bacterium]|nr:50S ribosomal protein L11 methyltransferase [Gemmatimonadaceae bacterium]
MTTSWVEVRVCGIAESGRDAVVRALVQAGAAGVQDVNGELVTHLEDSANRAALDAAVTSASAGAQVRYTTADASDWARAWPVRVGVNRVGRIAVAPPWLAAGTASAEIAILIDPAMAFGTGEHETTRGVLHLMQAVIRQGDFVADLGTGSAVLAIAAARLGAGRVAAIDLDHDAIGNAEENVARNHAEDRVRVIEGDAGMLLPLLAPVRVILANIISSVLLDLAAAMRAALTADGQAILSGMLASERQDVRRELERRRWEMGAELVEGDWWSCVVSPR